MEFPLYRYVSVWKWRRNVIRSSFCNLKYKQDLYTHQWHLISTGICFMFQGTQTGALYQPRGVGWGGRCKKVWKRKGHMYTCGWFMLRFDRKQQNCVKQLSFNKKIKGETATLFASWLKYTLLPMQCFYQKFNLNLNSPPDPLYKNKENKRTRYHGDVANKS